MFFLWKAEAQVQTGIWRSPLDNTEYNQFVRNGGGAALLINQVSANYAILGLSSETATAGTNLRFVVTNDGSVAIGKSSVTGGTGYRIVDVRGKGATTGGMLRLSTLDESSVARIYNNADLVFKTDKSTMKFRWINAANEEVYSVNASGRGVWSGNASSYTEVASNASGQYLRQYDNNGSTQAWIIRGYATGGVQAIFNKGGIEVNGLVHAKEVKVDAGNWPDYVFADTYQLPSLQETEAFIKVHQHLPGIPNQDEVAADGVDLGEMNRKLLEKVEELTLHIIDLNRKVEALEKK
ncbi:hypothetical protein GCM10023231_29400 [Olivibacter ginsenosidimutans]|uniref:Tail fiber domain-containing protein n=2 Tax=Olivibacter ginsenosidimutans TaxID=1176537 RepID=A0ABP9BUF0_9SPHI